MPWAWERGIEPVAMPGAMPGVTSGATPGTQTGATPGAAAIELGAQGDQASQGTGTPNDGALSVSEAVLLAKEQIAQLPNLVVTGEVTGFRGPNARSGHCYFQLKDENAAMDVTMWRWAHQKLGFELKDGLKVQLTGGFQVYDKRGSLSFNATSATVAGEGLLRQQVAELARKLEREGLMAPERKRPIPRFCTRIAVVTSLSGSVIDDVKRTLNRRHPLVELLVVGAQVPIRYDPAVYESVRADAPAAEPLLYLGVGGLLSVLGGAAVAGQSYLKGRGENPWAGE
jgi:exodeoxyribonuclease VII large subunit